MSNPFRKEKEFLARKGTMITNSVPLPEEPLLLASRVPRRNEKAKNDMQEIIVSLFAVAGYNPLDAVEVLEVALAGMKRVAAEAQQTQKVKR